MSAKATNGSPPLTRKKSLKVPPSGSVAMAASLFSAQLLGADGEIGIQIRDLDQTVTGNPAHDLIRLGLSLATVARGSDHPGVTTAKLLG
jgi:hypothetical protein